MRKVLGSFLNSSFLSVLELALLLQPFPSGFLLTAWTCWSRSSHQVSALFFLDDFEALSAAEDSLEDHGPNLCGPNHDPFYEGEFFHVLGTYLSQCSLLGEAAETSEYLTGVLCVLRILYAHLGCGSCARVTYVVVR